MQLKH